MSLAFINESVYEKLARNNRTSIYEEYFGQIIVAVGSKMYETCLVRGTPPPTNMCVVLLLLYVAPAIARWRNRL